MPLTPKRAAIVLAGGKAERFQSSPDAWQDKALVELNGKPLLVHVIENVGTVVDEIVVCVNDESRKAKYSDILRKYGLRNIRLVVDEKDSCLGGPLIAIDTGMRNVDADYCFTLPGDMPLMKAEVVEYMFQKAREATVAVPMWPNGRLETLSMVLERKNALEIADTLCRLRRPRSDDIIRGALNVWFLNTVGDIARLDPKLNSFVNINAPQDLTLLQPRGVQGPVKKSLHLKTGKLLLPDLAILREAAAYFRRGWVRKASAVFSSCAAKAEAEDSFFWAAVSRENEGKAVLVLVEKQPKSAPASRIQSESSKAFLKAAHNYELEAKMHEKFGCLFLSERALSDKAWCESRVAKR